ncbi:MAG: hypothetical protein QM730_21370 [Anaerolineales bacterium]
MNTSPFLSVNRPCEEALTWSREQLIQAGLRPIQTFDLHAARSGSHDCSCPNHGTKDCDCQMVVMLVYGNTDQPSTLILHGSDGQTWFSLVEDTSQPVNALTATAIKNSLNGGSPVTKSH